MSDTIKILGQQGLTLFDQLVKQNYTESNVTTEQIDDLFPVISEPDPIPTVKNFSTATNEEIAEIINAYYNGDLSLEDIQTVWNIGDTREIDISAIAASGGSGDTEWNVGESHRAQTATIEILDFIHDDLTTPINGKTKALITVDLKDCLMSENVDLQTGGNGDSEAGYINPRQEGSSTNINGWRLCARRAWCNNGFYNALPIYIKNLTKNVLKLTGIGGSSNTSIITTEDYVFLLSEKEVFNTTTYSLLGEGQQYLYYMNDGDNSKKYKLPGWGTYYRNGNHWWLRSPIIEDPTNNLDKSLFTCYTNVNRISYVNCNTRLGIAPAFCL